MDLYEAVVALPPEHLIDRYRLHQDMYSLLERDSDERDFLYAVKGDGLLVMRTHRIPQSLKQHVRSVTVPPHGADVFFRVELRAEYNIRRNGQRTHKPFMASDEQRWRPWAEAKLTAAGLMPSSIFLDDYHVFDIRRPLDNRRRESFKASHAVFVGRATVEDAELLARAMKNGIGRGKAYGAGLLQISTME